METSSLPTEFGSQHIQAMRVFILDREKLVLRSIGATREIWLPGEIKHSVCNRAPAHGHVKPVAECTCGIWSCHSRKYLSMVFPHDVYLPRPVPPRMFGFGPTLRQELFVTAQIEQWGTVIEHEMGYRSEYARIIPESIQIYPRRNQHKKLIKFLREKYDPVPS